MWKKIKKFFQGDKYQIYRMYPINNNLNNLFGVLVIYSRISIAENLSLEEARKLRNKLNERSK